MKVLFFYDSEIEVLGGAELSVMRLASRFLNSEHSAAILEFAPARSRRQLNSKIPVWSIHYTTTPTLRWPRSWLYFLRSVWQFLCVVREFEPDIVSVHFPAWQSLPVVLACVLPHKWRLVVTVHGSDIRIIPMSQRALRRWQKLLFKRAHAVTAVSKSLLQDLLDLYPFVRQRAYVIQNGVGTTWLEGPINTDNRNAEYVLFVGSLESIKGIDILLRAWQFVQKQFSDIQLWLVGVGSELNRLQALCAELGLRDTVRFMGGKDQTELPSLYRNASLVVIPSRNEGLPRVVLEAGACGVICVAANVGGLPEVIDNEINGFLVPPESPTELAEALVRGLHLPFEKRERMQIAARERIKQRFTESRMIREYEQLFLSLIGPAERLTPLKHEATP